MYEYIQYILIIHIFFLYISVDYGRKTVTHELHPAQNIKNHSITYTKRWKNWYYYIDYIKKNQTKYKEILRTNLNSYGFP